MIYFSYYEGIVAVIGDKAILKSEVEQQYLQLRASDVTNRKLRCEVMEELMFQKLLSLVFCISLFLTTLLLFVVRLPQKLCKA